MKKIVLEFADEEMESIEDLYQQIQETGAFNTLEEYLAYAVVSHCKTLSSVSKMTNQIGDLSSLSLGDNVHVGVVNMPINIADEMDKEEFSECLNQAINDAVSDFNDRHNGQLN